MQNSSYIDHIIVSPDTNYVCNTQVIEPDHKNTGDHLPVAMLLSKKLLPKYYIKDNSPDTPNRNSIPNYMWKNIKFTQIHKQKIADSISNHQKSGSLNSMDHSHHKINPRN